MTQQYLCGELALRLARLEQAAAGQRSCGDVYRLRRAVESSPPFALRGVVRRALMLSDALCSEALQHGDAQVFAEEAEIAADLHEFAICACLFEQE